uniref:Uncharacterized protein n=1 Tax=Cacopsylla melanoneura TaxID=428564 RepID=A0A8D8RM09_9HEMI
MKSLPPIENPPITSFWHQTWSENTSSLAQCPLHILLLPSSNGGGFSQSQHFLSTLSPLSRLPSEERWSFEHSIFRRIMPVLPGNFFSCSLHHHRLFPPPTFPRA